MEEKTTRKTLANCSAIEGFKQINKIRKEFSDLYAAIGVKKIKEKYAALANNPESTESADEISSEFLDEVLTAALDTNVEKAVETAGMMAFLSKEESAMLTIDDVYEIVTDCMQSRAFMDFFSSAVNSVRKDTGIT